MTKEYISSNAPVLREEIKELELKLSDSKSRLNQMEQECHPHVWGEVEYTPEHQEAYTIPGDPPGTMGVDWRPDCPVPAQTTKKWTRTCKRCGKEQVTTRTSEKKIEEPAW